MFLKQQICLNEFKASLVHRARSREARTTWRNPVSEKVEIGQHKEKGGEIS